MIVQPKGSKLCGHCCLATILDIPLEKAIELIGHERGTRTKELTRHFPHSKTKRGTPKTYSLCISRPGWKARRGDWHWIIYKDGRFYDPERGWIKEEAYDFCKVSSFVEVLTTEIKQRNN
jgi:hypothetical protein